MWQTQYANMAGMTTSKPIGGIRGKDKVNGLRKPNGPTWQEQQPVGPWEEYEVQIKQMGQGSLSEEVTNPTG